MYIIAVKTPKISNSTDLYEVSADTLQLHEGIILLDILDRVGYKTLSIPILNANNVPCSIGKNISIASIHPAGKCKEVQEVSWSRLWFDTSKLLPQIPQNTSLQLEVDTKGIASSI